MNSGTYRNVRGMDVLSGVLRALPEGMRQEMLLAGVKAADKVILVAAKRYAKRSEDTGALRESLTTKEINYPQSAKAVGLVGPDNDFYAKGRRIKGRFRLVILANNPNARRPSKYAHLVEYGHVIAVGGSLRDKYNLELVGMGKRSKSGREIRRWKRTSVKAKGTGKAGGFVPPKPFIRPAVITTAAQQEEAFARAVEAAYIKAVDREVQSGRHRRAA